MPAARSDHALRVLMPELPGQRWSCHSCGDCCRALTGHLTDPDRARIDEHDWAAELGVPPYVRAGGSYVLNKTADDACVFLDESNRCRIHSRLGEAAKPLACRIFPFTVRPVKDGWRAALRFDCPSVIDSRGAALSSHRNEVAELAARLPHAPVTGDAEFPGGLVATEDEAEAIYQRFVDATKPDADDGLDAMSRVVGLAHVSTTLNQATFAKVRGERLHDLLDILFTTMPAEARVEREPPGRDQLAMLRQSVLAHTEHVSVAELRAGIIGRSRKKLTQLAAARTMRRGIGTAPLLRGFPLAKPVGFEEVFRIAVASADRDAVSELLLRYVHGRLAGRSVFGAGYYGWPIFLGMSALWLSLAVVGWLARLHAASVGRRELALHDLRRALISVDRGITRLPSLGAASERLRTRYLLREDGACRLLRAFAWTNADR